MSEVKYYHVTETGLVEGTALGRLAVVLGADFDRVTAERDALKLLLNERDEQLHSLEQSRRTHFENGVAAERRIEDQDSLLLAWYEANANGLIQVEDEAHHIVTATAEALEGKSVGGSIDGDLIAIVAQLNQRNAELEGLLRGLHENPFRFNESYRQRIDEVINTK